MIAKGKSINVTLIFSLERYAEVAESYLRGLERLVAAGGDPGEVASVASFFVSRVDTEADRRLDEIGGARRAQGQARGRQREARLRALQASSSRASAGSTSPRRARRRSAACGPRPRRRTRPTRTSLYVEKLIGAGDRQHDARGDDPGLPGPRQGRSRRSSAALDKARQLLEELAEAGVDYDDVTETLEREGVEKFADSFDELLEGIRAKRAALAAGPAVTVTEAAENPLLAGLRAAPDARAVRDGDLRRLGRPDAAQALPGALLARLQSLPARASSASSGSPGRR